MDIQTTKLKLMQLLLDTQKEQVLLRIKEIFDQEEEVDIWDELSEGDQDAINDRAEASEKAIDSGEVKSFDKFNKDFEVWKATKRS